MKIQLSLDSDSERISEYLYDSQLLSSIPEQATVEKPGEGNMNVVLRYRFGQQSLILKQSKPYVNKYPSIPAPIKRINTEAKYYQYLAHTPALQEMMPAILLYDPDNHLIVMEDLGVSSDFLYLYRKDARLAEEDLQILMGYLSQLHGLHWSQKEIDTYPDNMELRRLNHQHIFELPFRADNGFDLDGVQQGLADVAKTYASDDRLKSVTIQLGQQYLAPGQILIHGDYYPGSWIRMDALPANSDPDEGGIRIIDPEFSFMGFPEFELGIFLAHMRMSGMATDNTLKLMQQYYQQLMDPTRVKQYAAVEIMRRLIGIAQLPLEMTLEEKSRLLEESHHILCP